MAFPTGWNRRCALTVDHTLVPSALTAFPVVIDASCLPSEMVTLGGGNAAQSDGGDIRFSSDSAGVTQLACEIVQWSQNATPASATAEIWVPLDLSSSVDTVFYVWYKAGGSQSQPAAGAAFGSQAVWDANAKGVWHLATSNFLGDSTASGDNATNHNTATQTSGKLDGAVSLASASSQWLDAPFVSGWDGSAQTASAWFKTSTTGVFQDILRRDNTSTQRNWALRLHTSNVLQAGLIWGGTSFAANSAGSVADGVWHLAHLVFSYDGVHTNGTLYLDGVAVGSSLVVTGAQTATSQLLDIGRYVGGSEYMNGLIDEAHMATTARSADWILGEYHNQNNPGAFTAAGTPVSTATFVVNPILGIDTLMGVCG